MKWKSEPDKGIYDAMNKGIERSSGTIIGIVNSDDWLEADALENVYASFVENGERTDCIYCAGMYFHSKDGNIYELKANLDIFKKYAKFGDVGGIRHPATFVPKFIYNKFGTFDTRMRISADSDFLLRINQSSTGERYVLVNELVTNMSDCGASNILSFDYIMKKMLPDRKLMMSNLRYPIYKQRLFVFLWAFKMIIKLLTTKLGIYRVR